MTAPDLSADEKAEVARFGIHETPGGLPPVRVEPEPELTNRYIASMLRRRWRERSPRGVWFYGTWLFARFHGGSVVAGLVSIPLGVWIAFLLTEAIR